MLALKNPGIDFCSFLSRYLYDIHISDPRVFVCLPSKTLAPISAHFLGNYIIYLYGIFILMFLIIIIFFLLDVLTYSLCIC